MHPPTTGQYLWITLLALPWLSIQAIWATEFKVVQPTMLKLGLSPDSASLIWLFGPISGFITAPLVGAYSDTHTSKYGRRRPFILTGLVLVAVFSCLFSFASHFGAAGVYIAYLSFIFLDVTMNVMQTPVRALASDLAPAHLQDSVQLLSVVFQGIGSVYSNYLAAATGYQDEPEQLPVYIAFVMAINICVVGLVLLFAKETPFEPQDRKMTPLEPFASIFKNIFAMDKKLFVVCLVEFFSWLAFFAWIPNAERWFKQTVYSGCMPGTLNTTACPLDSDMYRLTSIADQNYEYANLYQGLLEVFLALFLMAGLSFSTARRTKYYYACGLAFGSISLLVVKLFGLLNTSYAWLLVILFAIPMTVINCFPFSIVGSYNKAMQSRYTGVQYGVLNLFIC
ncbi:hypothetical protein HDU91_002411, partial [Kappamyces sp. JEL0680]